jgi:citronellol/citronellal dehydrogenase
MSLRGRTLFITGASRGIGLAIALRAARDGARVAIAAKTAAPHPKLPGTIYTAAEEIERAGGQALPLVVDVRHDAEVLAAVEKTVAAFGGIDICVNNASAIALTGTEATTMKQFDLMHQINARGTYLVTQACLPHLKRGTNPQVLMIAPPPALKPEWFAPHVGYTMAKYGMSLCVLGMAHEFRMHGIAVNALWPRTTIATAAVQFLFGGDAATRRSRTADIMAEAAYAILTKPASRAPSELLTGRFLIDDEVLSAEGVRDFDRFRVDPSQPLAPDLFIDPHAPLPPGVSFEPVAPT